MIEIEAVTGAGIAAHLEVLAAMRIAVFREPPYAYAGDAAYERDYLRGYAASADSIVVVARVDRAGSAGGREGAGRAEASARSTSIADRDRGPIVGAATALPLAAHGDDVAPPMVRAGYDPARVYYFGESVLEPAFRGRGIGARFFAEREARARALGYATAAFCAVEREGRPRADHGLWTRAGFVRRPDIVGTMSWRDVGAAEETAKRMVFWTKELA